MSFPSKGLRISAQRSTCSRKVGSSGKAQPHVHVLGPCPGNIKVTRLCLRDWNWVTTQSRAEERIHCVTLISANQNAAVRKARDLLAGVSHVSWLHSGFANRCWTRLAVADSKAVSVFAESCKSCQSRDLLGLSCRCFFAPRGRWCRPCQRVHLARRVSFLLTRLSVWY